MVTTPRETERIGTAYYLYNQILLVAKRIRPISQTRLKPDLISQGLTQATASKTPKNDRLSVYACSSNSVPLLSSVCPKRLPQWAALVWHVGAHLDRVMRPLCVWLDPACAASCWPALAARHLWPDQTRARARARKINQQSQGLHCSNQATRSLQRQMQGLLCHPRKRQCAADLMIFRAVVVLLLLLLMHLLSMQRHANTHR